MSYLPIARKYRPQTFNDVIGQEVVVRALSNAITLDRLHHAYLFCGIRGVGKTSLARILAKSLNCEQGPTLSPCGGCDACREISQGISMDVLEIDGASNTGVDDVRELKEQISYLPQKGKYKIYIIDEVHMLSTSAFNALLKVLEEPPPHVIFCFATTELHKIPLTILSRCQRFELRRIPLPEIVGHLRTIGASEKIDCDEESLIRIARLSDGSLRDSLSLLDQAISISDGKVTRVFLDEWLGFSRQELLYDVLSAVLAKDETAIVTLLQELSTTSFDPSRFLTDFLELVRHVILVRAGTSPQQLPELSADLYARLKDVSQAASAAELDWIFQMGTHGLQDLAQTPLPFYTLEILFLRFLRAHALREVMTSSPLAKPTAVEMPMTAKATPSSPPPPAPPSPKSKVTPSSEPTLAPMAQLAEQWHAFVRSLRNDEPQLGSLLGHVRWRWDSPTQVSLTAGDQKLHAEILKGKKDRLQDLASQFFNRKMTIVFVGEASATIESPQPLMESVVKEETKQAAVRQEKAEQAVKENSIVKTLTEVFGATLEKVKPL